jgi:hypothetical protein
MVGVDEGVANGIVVVINGVAVVVAGITVNVTEGESIGGEASRVGSTWQLTRNTNRRVRNTIQPGQFPGTIKLGNPLFQGGCLHVFLREAAWSISICIPRLYATRQLKRNYIIKQTIP